jgi:hypothetical protein
MRSQVFHGKGPVHQPRRHGANDHRIGWSESLEPRRDVRRFPQGEVFMPPTTAHYPHHNRAGVDANPHGKWHTILCHQTGIEGSDGLDHA